MSLFFYRAWAGADPQGGVREVSLQPRLDPGSPIYYTRWGYAALLGVTLLGGLVTNTIYLLGYLVCPRAMLQVPHIALVSLSVRDLLVCLTIMPAALDWLVAGLTSWPGGSTWCSTAVFFDYWLSTVHPLLVLLLCLLLYTRKVLARPPILPPAPSTVHQYGGPQTRSRSGYSSQNHSSRTSDIQSNQHQQYRTSDIRPPSVAGSVQSNASARHDGFRKGFAKAPGSVGGSRPPSVTGSNQGGRRSDQHLSPPSKYQVRSSSPLHQVEEGYEASEVEGELWELASMEYPGRNGMEHEIDDEEEDDPYEPRLREWFKYLVPLCWLAALGIGVPAAMQAVYDNKPPGCYLAAEPENVARSRHSYLLQDPTLNLLISSIVINYLLPATIMVMLAILLCTTRWTQDGKLNRFYKLAIALSVMFIVARSPIDIIQFKEVIHAVQGFSIINRRPDELEHEILLVWASFLPVVANPVIYMFCVTEYRDNIVGAWRACFGPKEKEEIIDQVDFNDLTSATKESGVL